MLVLIGLYKRALENSEFVFAYFAHHLMQFAFGVAILTCSIACAMYKNERNRTLP